LLNIKIAFYSLFERLTKFKKIKNIAKTKMLPKILASNSIIFPAGDIEM